MSEYQHFMDGMALIRAAFDRARINVAAIELLSPDDAMRLQSIIPPNALVRDHWLRPDGSSGGMAEIMGITIRWPTTRMMMPDGGWKDVP